eukprot:CAMPEP_0198315752 /NCGR_PEP_ID=MMETSP1450-20131203/5905_1 /TAXON_ID=753684 ORGANISM="Madagascaria erythrocladiodes, Strain CCMP3234" /NCGR_SAMPLE_ID=MMETSP1450 /ASSEMBLY_ACC=CAM_ASM_001115 /LENGTH=38 /DNA_ID= /DNA_START= /DNA_END= /DNA_ORIENTATION=
MSGGTTTTAAPPLLVADDADDAEYAVHASAFDGGGFVA